MEGRVGWTVFLSGAGGAVVGGVVVLLLVLRRPQVATSPLEALPIPPGHCWEISREELQSLEYSLDAELKRLREEVPQALDPDRSLAG